MLALAQASTAIANGHIMKSTKRLQFMSLAWIEGLSFNPANPRGIHLKKLGRDAIHINLAPQAPEDDPFGHRRGLECKVRRSYEVASNLHHFVDKLNARVLVPYPGVNLKLPHVGRRGELIAADGTLTDGYHFLGSTIRKTYRQSANARRRNSSKTRCA